jgi:hypothetical protein
MSLEHATGKNNQHEADTDSSLYAASHLPTKNINGL